jgi:outer membrane lipoprotein-sorting protein
MKLALAAFLMMMLGAVLPVVAQEGEPAAPTAAEILAAMDEAMNFPEGTMVLHFEDLKAGGTGRRLEARVLYALDAGTLVEFLSPEREKGKRVLMIGDSMWMGSPGVSRPVRLSGKDSFMGTSFTNDDVMNFTKADDYEARLLSTDANGWTLELSARKKSLPYPRVIAVVDRAYLPVRLVMFALSGQQAKKVEFGEVRAFEGKLRPATMTVRDAMTAGNRTVVSFLSIRAGRVDRARLSPAGFMK